jgi:hypothetical protein
MFFIAIFLKNFLDNIVANFSNAGNLNISFSAGFLFFFIYALILTFVSYNKMQNEL